MPTQVENANFANSTVTIPKVDEYIRCNFAVTEPALNGSGVPIPERIFPGDDTPRVFRECNLSNRIVPPGSTVDRCNCSLWKKTITESSVVVSEPEMDEKQRYVIQPGTYKDITYTQTVYGRIGLNGKVTYKPTPTVIEETRRRGE